MKIFEKRIRPSERERHYIIVPAKYIEYFPPPEVPFIVKVNKKTYKTYIDRYNRLRLGSRIFNELELDKSGSIFVIEKESERVYLIKRKYIGSNNEGH